MFNLTPITFLKNSFISSSILDNQKSKNKKRKIKKKKFCGKYKQVRFFTSRPKYCLLINFQPVSRTRIGSCFCPSLLQRSITRGTITFSDGKWLVITIITGTVITWHYIVPEVDRFRYWRACRSIPAESIKRIDQIAQTQVFFDRTFSFFFDPLFYRSFLPIGNRFDYHGGHPQGLTLNFCWRFSLSWKTCLGNLV